MENANITSNEFIEKLYGWTYNHAYDKRDAEDICHSIFLELLLAEKKQKELSWGYVWKIASNVLAGYYGKQNKLISQQSELDEMQLNVIAMSEPTFDEILLDEIEESEQLARVLRQIAYMSRIYRDVMVMFYLDRLPVSEIAKRLGITVNCVKQRLFSAKEKIRKEENMMTTANETMVKPATLWLPGSGDPTKSDLRDKLNTALAQNICVCCKDRAKSAAEIAAELGVATFYIEDTAEMLLGEPLKKTDDGKYIANFIIIDGDLQRKIDAKVETFLEDYAAEIGEYLTDNRDRIEAAEQLGIKQDFNAVCWALMPFVADGYSNNAEAIIENNLKNRGIEKDNRPFHVIGKAFRDEYNPKMSFYSNNGNRVGNYMICNLQGGARFNLPNRFGCWAETPGDLTVIIDCIGGLDCTDLDDNCKASLASATEKGYVKEIDGKYYPDIVIFKDISDYWKLVNSADAIYRKYADKIAEYFLKLIDKHVPAHLLGEAYYFTGLTTSSRHTVFETLIEKNILSIPEDSNTTVGIWARPVQEA